MKIKLIIGFIIAGFIITGCSDVRRDPGRVYMPDMAYSRAYETYAARDSDKFTTDINELGRKIFYNNMPVGGTIARGEELPFPLAKDAPGDSTNYVASKQIRQRTLRRQQSPRHRTAQRQVLNKNYKSEKRSQWHHQLKSILKFLPG